MNTRSMHGTNILDLSLPADAEGTCPACRGSRLQYDIRLFDVDGLVTAMHPAVVCDRCDFVRQIAPHQYVLGAHGYRFWDEAWDRFETETKKERRR